MICSCERRASVGPALEVMCWDISTRARSAASLSTGGWGLAVRRGCRGFFTSGRRATTSARCGTFFFGTERPRQQGAARGSPSSWGATQSLLGADPASLGAGLETHPDVPPQQGRPQDNCHVRWMTQGGSEGPDLLGSGRPPRPEPLSQWKRGPTGRQPGRLRRGAAPGRCRRGSRARPGRPPPDRGSPGRRSRSPGGRRGRPSARGGRSPCWRGA